MYCECGEDVFVWVSDTPLCVTHFNQWLETQSPLPKEDDGNSG